jgi:hypothetical protein
MKTKHKTHPIKINAEPRKNNGDTSNTLIGETTTYANIRTHKAPIHREWTPVRYVKIVCENIYEPV